MDTAANAREQIKKAIVDRGGMTLVANETGIHFTQIYAFLRGGGLRTENAGRLRLALPKVDDAVWADAFAPPPVTAVESVDVA